jgi:hypothetical protein
VTDLTPDELLALQAYAVGRRADLTATRLGEARCTLAVAGLVRDCAARESPMYVAVTDAGRKALAGLAQPVQLELFALAGGGS